MTHTNRGINVAIESIQKSIATFLVNLQMEKRVLRDQ